MLMLQTSKVHCYDYYYVPRTMNLHGAAQNSNMRQAVCPKSLQSKIHTKKTTDRGEGRRTCGETGGCVGVGIVRFSDTQHHYNYYQDSLRFFRESVTS